MDLSNLGPPVPLAVSDVTLCSVHVYRSEDNRGCPFEPPTLFETGCLPLCGLATYSSLAVP